MWLHGLANSLTLGVSHSVVTGMCIFILKFEPVNMLVSVHMST